MALRSAIAAFSFALATALIAAGAALAATVGERHLIAHNPTAALRDDQHRDTVRVTVWYPAAADAKEVSLDPARRASRCSWWARPPPTHRSPTISAGR